MMKSIRMLVADDSHLVQKLVSEAAAKSGLPLRVTCTDNGRDCLTLLQGHEVDLAFIDVNMPDLSGMDAFWAARKLGVQTFVTVMSSPPSVEAVEFARKLKAYEFLFKPFGADDVLNVVNTYARIKAPTRVMVVDDSQTVRSIVQKTISDSIFECRIADAADGERAIALCENAPFDVVFLDCNMPGLSGLQTLSRLRARRPDLKVVMISSERDATRERQARDCGAYAFLPKPFNADDIDRVLHDIHGLRSPHLRLERNAADFDVAIEGSTIRLVHTDSGHVFEYLWFKDAPHLRNGTVNRGETDGAEAALLAAVAEKAALRQLSSARLLAAA